MKNFFSSTFLSLALVNGLQANSQTVKLEDTFVHYNLYDRNKYHYDFPLRKGSHVINSPPEEPWRIYFNEDQDCCDHTLKDGPER
jgi:hypothetical protein